MTILFAPLKVHWVDVQNSLERFTQILSFRVHSLTMAIMFYWYLSKVIPVLL